MKFIMGKKPMDYKSLASDTPGKTFSQANSVNSVARKVSQSFARSR